MSTKQHLGEFDCYANALPNEPMFVLLARDPKAATAVRDWAAAYRNEKEKENIGQLKHGRLNVKQYAKYIEALDCADAMESWLKDFRNAAAVTQQKRDIANAPTSKAI